MTHSYSWKPCKNDTVDVSSSAYHSMSKWANQYANVRCENEADDRSGSEHCLKCGWNIPVEFLAKSLWYSDCSDRYWFCEADKQIRYSQVNQQNEVRFSLFW